MVVLSRFTLNKDGVRSHLEDGLHPHDVCFHNVLERRNESLISRELLVPPTIARREQRADVHLINRSVELDPRITGRESPRIAGEEFGKIRILKVANPIRHTEMAEVRDGHDVASMQIAKGFVAE